MPKNDFESTNFANFVEVVHNFGRSDVAKKMFIFNTCRLGLMPNLIKKSWTVSNQAAPDQLTIPFNKLPGSRCSYSRFCI